jgi:ABC-type transport system involved in multi-copper enzyme maturation permease subunit
MNLNRTIVIAANVFRQVIRERALYLLGFFTVVLAVAVLVLSEVASGGENQMILDVGLAAIELLGLAVAVVMGAGLVNQEIATRTIYVMVAKPISCTEFIVGKHWGLTAVLGVLVAAMTTIYLGVVTIKQIPVPLVSVALSALFQTLELSLIAAIAVVFGILTGPLLAMPLTIAVYLMGHLSHDLLDLATLSDSPSLRQATEGLFLILPDLTRLNLKNQAVYGLAALPPAPELLGHLAYGVTYISLLLAIATGIFARRQF